MNRQLSLGLMKPFFYMTKTSRQKFKYLENENSFQGEIKCNINHFGFLKLKIVLNLRVHH